MKRPITKSGLLPILLFLLILSGSGWVGVYHKGPTPLAFPIPPGWPSPVYDLKANPPTEEGFQLGMKLFYDGRLSRDGNFSCESCHQPYSAFSTYQHSFSHGINNSLTTRNAPALQNLAWQTSFMWDGSIGHLDNQPIAPITAPGEMGETPAGIIRKLQADADYRKLFRLAFKDGSISMGNIDKALSQFMVMLVSSDSKYDRVMRGEASFILPEKLGYGIFQKKCASCHAEPFFTDFSFRNNGMPVDERLQDGGRSKVTGRAADSLAFRVPSLRNVAVTGPYGHDGRFFSLLSVFEHYRKNMVPGPTTDSLLLHKIALSNFEIGQLTAFLYTLTDTVFLKNRKFCPPGYDLTPYFVHFH
ncbi:MAG: cytochrome-c peroxidase [Puia sp.]|nr:cytochrome-c peroxidase [Puia sp.]